MIINFIRWLSVVSFQDRQQDIMFLFMGSNEKDQGQGSGKGVLIGLFEEMYSVLITSVSNKTYNEKFNSDLMNKKIIIYDELNFKILEYDTLKDTTGNHKMRIEFKGKEPISVKNVSSWLGFTNKSDLLNKITIEDRRIFLIRPNPENGSIERIIKDNFDGVFNNFKNKLHSEIEEFIHIISNQNGKVKSPIELKSQGHINYFKEQRKVSILDINNLYKIFIETNFRDKVFDTIDTIIQLNNNTKEKLIYCKNILKLNTINYKIFKQLFEVLQQYDFIPKNNKSNKEWVILKENLIRYNYKQSFIDLRQTKQYERFRDTTVFVSNDTTKEEKLKINRYYRKVFGILRPST